MIFGVDDETVGSIGIFDHIPRRDGVAGGGDAGIGPEGEPAVLNEVFRVSCLPLFHGLLDSPTHVIGAKIISNYLSCRSQGDQVDVIGKIGAAAGALTYGGDGIASLLGKAVGQIMRSEAGPGKVEAAGGS